MKTIRAGVCLPVVCLAWAIFVVAICVGNACGQTTGFTYQGRLTEGGTPANGNYGFVFRLYTTADGETQIGPDVNIPVITVENGVFTATLDFGGNAFPGADRFLQIIVYHSDASGIPVILSPRQQLTSTPYAIRALSAATANSATTADTATNATQLGGMAANQFVLTGDARLSDARTPTPGSSDYIQNTTSPQFSSNFSVTGTGKANILEANTQLNLSGARVLSTPGTSNLFAGPSAGAANTSGNRNSFFGELAGNANTSGDQNSFFGKSAGQFNTEGRFNNFFGDSSGSSNTTGNFNVFFGAGTGSQNTAGSGNTFVGNQAGQTNNTGSNNTLLGSSSSVLNNNLTNATAIGSNASVAQNNALILGSINGVNGATADTNVGIGTTTPAKRLHVIGDGVFEGNLNVTGSINGTFTGTIQTANNALNLGGVAAGQYVQTGDARLSDARPPIAGSSNYIQNGTAPQPATNFNVSGTGQAAAFDAATQFNIAGIRVLSTTGANNFFAGPSTGQSITTGDSNSFFGSSAGQSTADGRQNAFFGRNAGQSNTNGSFNAFFGSGAGSSNIGGNNNAFFGFTSGRVNTTGANNSFFGNAAGFSNVDSSNNAFFGFNSGHSATGVNGGLNSFFGASTGTNTVAGFQNSFFGYGAGTQNTGGSSNTAIGYNTDLGSGNLFNATAIGAQALVTQSNSLVLGSINGVNGATADTNVGIGTTAPTSKLHVVGDGLFTGNLTVNGSLNATVGMANNALQLDGVAANQYVQTTDSRLTDARTPTAGSPNYIQNGTTPQAGSNFNITGNGTVGGNLTVNGSISGNISLNTVNATTQYNLGGAQIIGGNGDPQVGNFFAGFRSGQSLTNGGTNSFFGVESGKLNDTGGHNSFFGYQAGANNTGGFSNSYFGHQAGFNCTGIGNSFFGQSAGFGTAGQCTGGNNSIFGQTGGSLTSGSQNTAIGQSAGGSLRDGSNNSFLGYSAGSSTVGGSNNTFVGQQSGGFNSIGSENTAIGSQAYIGDSVAKNNLTNATAIGSHALVTQSDSLVLGSISGVNFAAADTKVGIGTTAPTERLHVVGNGLFTGNLTVNGTINGNIAAGNANYIQNTTTQQAATNFNISGDGTAGGTLNGNVVNATTQFNLGGSRLLSATDIFNGSNTSFGLGSGAANGNLNSFFGAAAGGSTTGDDNSFFGSLAGQSNAGESFNTFIGTGAGNRNGHGDTSQTANSNTFVGSFTGNSNTTGGNNSFLGANAGTHIRTGSDNTFMGTNTNVGAFSDDASGVSLFGSNARANVGVSSNATAIGYNALVNRNDALVLGNTVTNVGIGTPAPNYKLEIVDGSNTGLRVQNISAGATVASFGAKGAFQIDDDNNAGGRFHVAENGNVGIGTNAPQDRLHVNGGVRVTNGSIYVTNPNTLIITSPNGLCWGITVTNSGALATFSVTCPQ